MERKRSLEAAQRAAPGEVPTVAAALPGHVAAQREVLVAVAGELAGIWGAQGFRSEPLGGGGDWRSVSRMGRASRGTATTNPAAVGPSVWLRCASRRTSR